MMDKAQFLKNEDIINFKKDTCIFCNETLPTREIIGQTTKCVGSDDDKEWIDATRKIIYCADLDIYHFTFTFPQEERKVFERERQALYETLVQRIQRTAERRREELERTLPLEGRERMLAVEVIVNDLLRSVDEKSLGGSVLRRELEAAQYKFFFPDLQRACYEKGTAQGSFEEVLYKPKGLKTHTSCWPYAAVLQDRKERIQYRDFLTHLEKTRIGKGYTQWLEQHPEFFALTKNIHLDLHVKRYNPLEFL